MTKRTNKIKISAVVKLCIQCPVTILEVSVSQRISLCRDKEETAKVEISH